MYLYLVELILLSSFIHIPFHRSLFGNNMPLDVEIVIHIKKIAKLQLKSQNTMWSYLFVVTESIIWCRTLEHTNSLWHLCCFTQYLMTCTHCTSIAWIHFLCCLSDHTCWCNSNSLDLYTGSGKLKSKPGNSCHVWSFLVTFSKFIATVFHRAYFSEAL
jgi:hypothetical protein